MSKYIKTELFSAKAYTGFPCELEIFRVKKVRGADKDDFGASREFGKKKDPSDWEPVCVNRKFVPKARPAKGVLEKYGITLDEYREIGAALKDILYVGECSLCL